MSHRVVRLSPYQVDEKTVGEIHRLAQMVNELYDAGYDFSHWDIDRITSLASGHYLAICYDGDKVTGLAVATRRVSFFQPSIRILQQELLFSLPNSRASLLLLKDFIDFGKANADHIITCIGVKTNIKSSSLEKLGFSKLEESYVMEV